MLYKPDIYLLLFFLGPWNKFSRSFLYVSDLLISVTEEHRLPHTKNAVDSLSVSTHRKTAKTAS